MGSRRRLWVGVAVVVIGSGLLAAFYLTRGVPGCVSQLVREEASPDGRLRAIQYTGACMLTPQVYWLEVKSPFWFGTEVFRYQSGFDFCWKSASELVVDSLPAPLLMKTEARGAKVIFGGTQECEPQRL